MASIRLLAPARSSQPGSEADHGTTPQDDLPSHGPDRPRVVAAAAVRALTWAAWAIAVLPMAGRPLGFSHDGRNAGVFSLMARGIDQLGWAGSNWGSTLANDLGSYAHHPPLIVWLTALSEGVGGTHPFWTRLPTVVASALTIVLLHRICRRLTDDPLAAALGSCVAATTPMFLVYGWMLDTPMLALPAGMFLADRWLALEEGEAVRPVTWAIGAFVAAIAGWLGTALAGVLGLTALWRGWRLRRSGADPRDPEEVDDRPSTFVGAGAWLLVGTAAATVVTMAWIAASSAGLADLLGQAAQRTGRDPATELTVLDALSIQVDYVVDVWFPVPVVLTILCWRAGRPVGPAGRVVVLLAGTTALYSLVFWNATTYHAYWLIWLVAPLAVVVTTGLTRWSRHRQQNASTRLLVALAVVATVAGLVWPGLSRQQLQGSAADGELVARSALAPGQDRVLALGVGGPFGWISYATDTGVESLGWTSLAEASSIHPDWHVLVPLRVVGGGCGTSPMPVSTVLDAGSFLAVVRAEDAARWLRPPDATSGTGSRRGSSSCR